MNEDVEDVEVREEQVERAEQKVRDESRDAAEEPRAVANDEPIVPKDEQVVAQDEPVVAQDERVAEEARASLFEDDRASDLRTRWSDVQSRFVDDPREAVKAADMLVEEVVRDLSSLFAAERSALETQWGRDQKVSTEDLRVALRRYRSFFERLLSV